MFNCALLILALHPTFPPSVPPPPPTSEIIISERLVTLPYLPENVAKAHAEIGPIGTSMVEGLKDLERTLKELYASPEARIPLPSSFKFPRSRAEEFRFLISVVSEERYRELEVPFFQAWDEWQAVLVENGLAQPAQTAPSPIQPSPSRERENKELQIRKKGMRKSDYILEAESRDITQAFTSPRGGTNWKGVATVLGTNAESEDRINTTRAISFTANRHAPALSKTWAPLAERLNADALHLANLEMELKPSVDIEVRTLMVQARIHFLERFRWALWLSSVVWARMTTSPSPAPLQDLDSRSVLGVNHATGQP